MKLFVTLLFAAVITGSLGAHIVDGPCRTLDVVSSFDVEAYMGTWYELNRYDFDQEAGLDCGTAEYTLLDDGSVQVINSATDLSTENHYADTGSAWLSFPYEFPLRGLLNVTFTDAPADKVNYRILSTDYDSYSVVWSCTDLPDGSAREYAWVLARSYPADATVQAAIDNVVSAHLDSSALRTTVQEQLTCIGGGISPAE